MQPYAEIMPDFYLIESQYFQFCQIIAHDSFWNYFLILRIYFVFNMTFR